MAQRSAFTTLDDVRRWRELRHPRARVCTEKRAPGKFYLKDVFPWFPTVTHACKLKFDETYQGRGVRAYYYTSIVGDDRKIESVKESLWELGFEPKVFKRPQRQQRSKGVDISLTVDLLSHANRNGYDTALLVAGDDDYVPLVEEVKRLGKRVDVGFLGEEGLSPTLRLASDTFFHPDQLLIDTWSPKLGPEPAKLWGGGEHVDS